ncbi:MAG: VTC domain-containing protein, partial [Clostridia bacterium]|nr:VTC domain-containing protein [Clostridia bacterium]
MTKTFERNEKKYLLTLSQYERVFNEFSKYLKPDEYGEQIICNEYFDTDDYRLIRASIEKPSYKEKLRLRSYGIPNGESEVYLELK